MKRIMNQMRITKLRKETTRKEERNINRKMMMMKATVKKKIGNR